MIILDTNVLSALMLEAVESTVIDWLDDQPRESIWTSSISVFEIRYGLETMPVGRRRASFQTAFGRLIGEKLERRVVALDHDAAEAAAALMARRKVAGTPRDLRDTMIAGIALARRAVLATRNVRHFNDSGLKTVDPWATDH